MKYEFTRDLETGYKTIDDQHRALIDALNKLFDACSSGKGREGIYQAAQFLMQYTSNHFRDEERIQAAHRYPDFANHKKMHDDFKAVVAGLMKRLDNEGPTIAVVGEVNRAVAGWLISHIKKEDKKLAEYIAGHPA